MQTKNQNFRNSWNKFLWMKSGSKHQFFGPPVIFFQLDLSSNTSQIRCQLGICWKSWWKILDFQNFQNHVTSFCPNSEVLKTFWISFYLGFLYGGFFGDLEDSQTILEDLEDSQNDSWRSWRLTNDSWRSSEFLETLKILKAKPVDYYQYLVLIVVNFFSRYPRVLYSIPTKNFRNKLRLLIFGDKKQFRKEKFN